MKEDEKLRVRALFVYVIGMLKSQSEMTAKISSELASLHGAVHGLYPTFEEVLEHTRTDVDEITDPIVRANLHRYDEMIQRVEAGEFL